MDTDVESSAENLATGVNYVEEARQRATVGDGNHRWLNFPLIEIEGEPLSTTIIRERRGNFEAPLP